MNPLRRCALPVLAILLAAPSRAASQAVPSLPVPISNNAVASGRTAHGWTLFSALGIDSSKQWSGIVRRAFSWTPGAASWRELPPVPGRVGRLAANAAVVRGRLFVFGGYTVDSAGGEVSLSSVDIYDPVAATWSAGAPIPVAVDDMVAGVYRDSLVYLVSGWHNTNNVSNVQLYDVRHDRWAQATPFPGVAVFGGSGELAESTIVLIDGARRTTGASRYTLAPQAWAGRIDPRDATRITWVKLPPHPGPPRYRAAAAPCGPLVVIAGGTDNPYNFNGIGYDGRASAPLASVIAFDTREWRWQALASAPRATMDHRALAIDGARARVVGGMRDTQRVAADAVEWHLDACTR
jgi:N-acetylneuraminic acid mutarotase